MLLVTLLKIYVHDAPNSIIKLMVKVCKSNKLFYLRLRYYWKVAILPLRIIFLEKHSYIVLSSIYGAKFKSIFNISFYRIIIVFKIQIWIYNKNLNKEIVYSIFNGGLILSCDSRTILSSIYLKLNILVCASKVISLNLEIKWIRSYKCCGSCWVISLRWNW